MTIPKKLSVLRVEDEPADAHWARQPFEGGLVRADLHHVLDGIETFDFLRRENGHAYAPAPAGTAHLRWLRLWRVRLLRKIASVASRPGSMIVSAGRWIRNCCFLYPAKTVVEDHVGGRSRKNVCFPAVALFVDLGKSCNALSGRK